MGKTSSASKNRWNAANYDRIAVTVPKGTKATIQAAAKAAGQSTNAFIVAAIAKRMEE